MSLSKMTEMHTDCFRCVKFESIFSRPLLNVIKFSYSWRAIVFIFWIDSTSKSHRHIKNSQHRDSGILQCGLF